MKDDSICNSTSKCVSTQSKQKINKKKSKSWSEIKWFGIRLLTMILILYIMFGVFFGLMPMPNEDMKPKISAGDLMLFYRLDQTYQIGDVLIYSKEDKTYVGRVVAKEGDEVNISKDHFLQINGNTVMESDIYYPTGEYEGGISLPVKIPLDSYFILCDLREGGKDSRILGAVSRADIAGKVITVIRRSGI